MMCRSRLIQTKDSRSLMPAFLFSLLAFSMSPAAIAQGSEDSTPQYNPLEGLFTPQPQYPTAGKTIMNQEPIPQHIGSDAAAPGRQPGTVPERYSGPEDLRSGQPKMPDAPNQLEGVFTAQPQYPKPGTTHLNPEPIPRYIGDDGSAAGRQPGSRVNVFQGESTSSEGASGEAANQDKTNALRGLFTAQPQYVTPGKTVMNPDAVPKHLGDDSEQPGRQPGSQAEVFQHGLPSSSEKDQSFSHLAEDSSKSDSATPEAKDSDANAGQQKESVEAQEARDGVKVKEGEAGDKAADKDKENADKDKEGADKDKESVDKDKEGADKDKEGADKDKESVDKDKESVDKDKENVDKDKENADKDKKNVDKDKENVDKDKENVDKDKENADKDKEGADKDSDKERAEKEENEDKGIAGAAKAGSSEENDKAHHGKDADKEKAAGEKTEDEKDIFGKSSGKGNKKEDEKNKVPPNNNPLAAAIHMLQIGEYQQSLDMIGKLINAHPLNPQLYYTRAVVYVSMRKYLEAATDYRKVLSLAPVNSELAVLAKGGLSKLNL